MTTSLNPTDTSSPEPDHSPFVSAASESSIDFSPSGALLSAQSDSLLKPSKLLTAGHAVDSESLAFRQAVNSSKAGAAQPLRQDVAEGPALVEPEGNSPDCLRAEGRSPSLPGAGSSSPNHSEAGSSSPDCPRAEGHSPSLPGAEGSGPGLNRLQSTGASGSSKTVCVVDQPHSKQDNVSVSLNREHENGCSSPTIGVVHCTRLRRL